MFVESRSQALRKSDAQAPGGRSTDAHRLGGCARRAATMPRCRRNLGFLIEPVPALAVRRARTTPDARADLRRDASYDTDASADSQRSCRGLRRLRVARRDVHPRAAPPRLLSCAVLSCLLLSCAVSSCAILFCFIERSSSGAFPALAARTLRLGTRASWSSSSLWRRLQVRHRIARYRWAPARPAEREVNEEVKNGRQPRFSLGPVRP